MKIIFFIIYMLAAVVTCGAQIATRTVIPIDVKSIEYPNLTGNTWSSQPHAGTVNLKNGTSVKGKITFFKKKDVFERVKVKTEAERVEIPVVQIASITLDPKVIEGKYANNFKNPEKNFQPGYIVLPTGEKLQGMIAQVRDFSDYDFFVYTILFLPENSQVASGILGGKLTEFGQLIDGTMRVWDGYADGYLYRMVDGRYRLSRNPYSSSKAEFFTLLKSRAADTLGKQAASQALASSLRSGSNLNESIENAANASTNVTDVLGQIEITRKEYLIFDTRSNKATAVNKDTFPAYAQTISAGCNIAAGLLSWDKIEEFIKSVNANCK